MNDLGDIGCKSLHIEIKYLVKKLNVYSLFPEKFVS